MMPRRPDPDQVRTQPIPTQTLAELAAEWRAEQRRQFNELEQQGDRR